MKSFITSGLDQYLVQILHYPDFLLVNSKGSDQPAPVQPELSIWDLQKSKSCDPIHFLIKTHNLPPIRSSCPCEPIKVFERYAAKSTKISRNNGATDPRALSNLSVRFAESPNIERFTVAGIGVFCNSNFSGFLDPLLSCPSPSVSLGFRVPPDIEEIGICSPLIGDIIVLVTVASASSTFWALFVTSVVDFSSWVCSSVELSFSVTSSWLLSSFGGSESVLSSASCSSFDSSPARKNN